MWCVCVRERQTDVDRDRDRDGDRDIPIPAWDIPVTALCFISTVQHRVKVVYSSD